MFIFRQYMKSPLNFTGNFCVFVLRAKSVIPDIGDRRELFLDNYLIDSLTGTAQRIFHKPLPREVVMDLSKEKPVDPWDLQRYRRMEISFP